MRAIDEVFRDEMQRRSYVKALCDDFSAVDIVQRMGNVPLMEDIKILDTAKDAVTGAAKGAIGVAKTEVLFQRDAHRLINQIGREIEDIILKALTATEIRKGCLVEINPSGPIMAKTLNSLSSDVNMAPHSIEITLMTRWNAPFSYQTLTRVVKGLKTSKKIQNADFGSLGRPKSYSILPDGLHIHINFK